MLRSAIPPLLALALGGCAPSALAVRDTQPPPPAIDITLHTVPLQVGKVTYTGANFVAAEPGRRNPPFIAESRNFEFGDYDRAALALGQVPDRPELRAILAELVSRLEAHGWHRTGPGEGWYGARLTR